MMRAMNNVRYDVDNYTEQNGLTTFHTSKSWRTWAAKDMSMFIFERGPSKTELVIDGEKRSPLQLWDWGEVKSIAEKLFREFETLLKSSDSSKISVP
jgi:hypothetical protein